MCERAPHVCISLHCAHVLSLRFRAIRVRRLGVPHPGLADGTATYRGIDAIELSDSAGLAVAFDQSEGSVESAA
jgi:hypothetical protein